MNVHLIQSEEFATARFTEVVEFLQSFDGPVKFINAGASNLLTEDKLSEEPVDAEKFFMQDKTEVFYMSKMMAIPEERMEAKWNDLFDVCQIYRKANKLAANDMVLLLTEVANEHNWFSALDPKNKANGFVHTAEWSHYVKCSEVFPVAYLIASLVLQKHMFNNMRALQKSVHMFPLGCINDFCEHKREIILKLRTADVCFDCMELLKNKLEPLEIQQMLDIFEGVRLRILFTQNFRRNLKPSRLLVSRHYKIYLPDYGNIEIKLTPLERTLYLFFLNHPEGVMLHNLVDHKEELRKIYSSISNSGLLAEIHNRIAGLTDVTSNSASEKISKIKSAFIKAIGKSLAQNYYIQGENNQKKLIPLEPTLYVKEQ